MRIWDDVGMRYLEVESIWNGRDPLLSGEGWAQRGNATLDAAPGKGDYVTEAEVRGKADGRSWRAPLRRTVGRPAFRAADTICACGRGKARDAATCEACYRARLAAPKLCAVCQRVPRVPRRSQCRSCFNARRRWMAA